jgi:glycosyltransferase involved in cell wall biosynthesis
MRGFMEPEPFFREVDVVVQLSLWENCSYSVLDAVVRGKGVVATEVGGYVEYLPRRCLVPVGNASAAAARMLQQATNVALRPTLPPDWPSVAEMTDRIGRVYADVMQTRSRQSAVAG